jgi:exopolyphosphatase/guanosine-5'-triphosphate,3'-diphosphate pyrophosphatase
MDRTAGPVKVAAFDIGSNSIKMTVATVIPGGQVTEGYSDMRTVRLGAGVDQTGRLADDRIAAALEALDELTARATGEGAVRMIGVATEAVRVATNGAAFLEEVTRRTGIEITLISGDQEARLTYTGLSSIRPLVGSVVMVDIGGASTEVVAGDGPNVAYSTSIPLGSGRLTDAYLADDPPTPDQIAQARVAAGAQLDKLELRRFSDSHLIVSGGTGTYLGAFLNRADDLSRQDIEQALDQMSELNAEALGIVIGIPPLRARVLPAGVAVVLECIDRLRPTRVSVSPSGLRFGLLQAAAKGTSL